MNIEHTTGVAHAETVLVNLTEGDRPLDDLATRSECVWLKRAGDAWEPEASTATLAHGHSRRSSGT